MNDPCLPVLYLASGSPRRRELLEQIGVSHRLVTSSVDESVMPGECPEEYVQRLAIAKACAGLAGVLDGGLAVLPVLGADTTVVTDGRILGKPASKAEGVAMLMALSGREHRVLTAVCLTDGQRHDTRLADSRVHFRVISVAEAEAYWSTGEPCDKAGGYGIQGLGAVFVQRIAGSYSGIVGLPLAETAELLTLYGVPFWQVSAQ